MSPMKPAAEPMMAEALFRHMQIIHRAMIGAVGLYGLVGYLLLVNGTIPPGGVVGPVPILRPLLWLAAFGNFVAIDRIRSWFLTPEALRQRARPVAQSIATWHIILYALADAIAIYGLMLFLIAGLTPDFLAMASGAVAILFWLRPNEARVSSLLRQTRPA
jgi:F0F1-type ATP synthase membrane subunit c/vacuolar-type H+-ATPase subunit K